MPTRLDHTGYSLTSQNIKTISTFLRVIFGGRGLTIYKSYHLLVMSTASKLRAG
jgi:hypothetical protein